MNDTVKGSINSLKDSHLAKLYSIRPGLDGFLAQVDLVESPNAGSKKMPLDKMRRETLKLSQKLDELQENFDASLSLEFVEEDMHPEIMAVVEARREIAMDYFRCSSALKSLREMLKGLSGKSSVLTERVNEINAVGKKVMRKLQVLVLDTPELGMTFAEWASLDDEEKKELRPQGRPRAPIEVEILQAESEIDYLVNLCSEATDGKLNTLDKVIDGVELSRQGRPQLSPLGRLNRKLINSLKRLESLMVEEKTRFHDIKKNRLKDQIQALRDEISHQESLLEGADVYKWELEQLRSDHRDMVVTEQTLKGEEQIAMLLEIMRNEDRQITVVDMIRDLDPSTNLTVTHRVNPAATRDRFERIRENGRLSSVEMQEVDEIEERLESYGRYRSR